MQIRRLAPSKTPQETVQSRRNPCYGFAIVADIQEHKELASMLEETRDEILKIVDPDRVSKPRPIRSPLYIKQKFFHASVFGMSPLLEKEQFAEIYANEKGQLSPDAMDEMCGIVRTHLEEQKPFLEPVKCELMKDGNILVRFNYKTASKDKDDTPLLTLVRQLDPAKKFSQWDVNNPARSTTVTVVICAIDTDKMNEKLDALQYQLDLASKKLTKLGNIKIEHFKFIDSYDKRTLFAKHVSLYADIGSKEVRKMKKCP